MRRSPRHAGRPHAAESSAATVLTFDVPGVDFGKERCFIVRARGANGDMRVESEASPPGCLTPVDTFPPAAAAEPARRRDRRSDQPDLGCAPAIPTSRGYIVLARRGARWRHCSRSRRSRSRRPRFATRPCGRACVTSTRSWPSIARRRRTGAPSRTAFEESRAGDAMRPPPHSSKSDLTASMHRGSPRVRHRRGRVGAGDR